MDLHRIIYSLHLSLESLPGSPAGAFAGLVVPLDRNGMSIGRNGRPRPPKQRSIDLRGGDDVMVNGHWRRVLDIKSYRESYAKPEQVEAVAAGYVVRREA